MKVEDEEEKKGFRPGVHVERPSRQRPIKPVNPDTGEVTGLTKPSEIVQSLLEQHGIATSLTPAQQVEEDLKAITVCEECRERPLGMKRWAIQERRHRERPWLCQSCAPRRLLLSLTPEQLSERARKANAGLTPGQRRRAARKANASRTAEQRSKAARKAAVAKHAKKEQAP